MSARLAYEHWLLKWSDIQDHLPLLYDSAKGNCLEIGVRQGVSTSALLAGIEDHGGHLWSIDCNPCPVFLGHRDWTFRQADSLQDTKTIKTIIPDKLDLAFIDGDHTYQGALSDLHNFGSMATRVLVHDTDCPETFPGVRRAVDRYCSETHRKVTYHHGSFGMAEIQ